MSAAKPEPLKILSLSTLPEHEEGTAILKDRELVVVGGEYGAAQLLTFDIRDRATPRQLEAMDMAVSENYMVPILVTTRCVVLANGSGGLEVLDYSR